jgi:hypothetical protein
MVIEIGLLQIQRSALARFLGRYLAFGVIEPPLWNVHRHGSVFKMLGKWGLSWPLQFVSGVVEGAAQPVGGEAQGTVRLCDPQESPRHMETAESGERGERRRAMRSAPRQRAAPGAHQPYPDLTKSLRYPGVADVSAGNTHGRKTFL